ncbi:hypothetical protein GCM10022243_23260 [Saccharothrix violaceirubra]|uniref:Uncharacterized protein n=1 Tax=Saccharothrix violaceirubra TaxID=413306 RepID=A0A7W7T1A8_9PSEU|nr:hypothetical protein [Saccharothrix violaceirubra]MBB4964735.1 hypothetical protein [Saccharothrix violaceirubra]
MPTPAPRLPAPRPGTRFVDRAAVLTPVSSTSPAALQAMDTLTGAHAPAGPVRLGAVPSAHPADRDTGPHAPDRQTPLPVTGPHTTHDRLTPGPRATAPDAPPPSAGQDTSPPAHPAVETLHRGTTPADRRAADPPTTGPGTTPPHRAGHPPDLRAVPADPSPGVTDRALALPTTDPAGTVVRLGSHPDSPCPHLRAKNGVQTP